MAEMMQCNISKLSGIGRHTQIRVGVSFLPPKLKRDWNPTHKLGLEFLSHVFYAYYE
jgi:hypothetical protein